MENTEHRSFGHKTWSLSKKCACWDSKQNLSVAGNVYHYQSRISGAFKPEAEK